MKCSICAIVLLILCSSCSKHERMRGLWRNDFEGSQFCPAPARTCAYVPKDERTSRIVWLDVSETVPVEYRREHRGALFAVDFIGRRHSFGGSYGHMGMYDEEIIVYRMISMTEIEAPPPQTNAEMIRYWKECESAGNCIPNWEATNKVEQ